MCSSIAADSRPRFAWLATLLLSGTALAAGSWTDRPIEAAGPRVAPDSVAWAEARSSGSTHRGLKPKQPQRFRLPDDRPPLDRAALRSQGFTIVESTHLVLVTDLPADAVTELPPLADALFEELERQLGKLTPAENGSEFQLTGFLMQAAERFDQAGLLPPEQFSIRHGRNVGYRFWMNNQTEDYYRRHLMLHEFTHCFLMCEYGMIDIPPLWYTEGIAECFATHSLSAEDQATFGVLPESGDAFRGWERIRVLKESFDLEPAATVLPSGMTTLTQVRFPASGQFTSDQNYAQAWALVWLIRNHPDLQQDFAAFDTVRTSRQFLAAADSVPKAVWKRLAVMWPLVIDSLTDGFDGERSFPELSPMLKAASAAEPRELTLHADRGWQSAGLQFKSGQEIEFTCSGRYVVETDPKPWISEPQGITIDYHRGRPLGEVVAMFISGDGSLASRRIIVGTGTRITAPVDGELWLQINDAESSRENNSGIAIVTLSIRE